MNERERELHALFAPCHWTLNVVKFIPFCVRNVKLKGPVIVKIFV